MTPEEFDTSLTDLETRVDRLRALYENWFRGYEKTEPSVARKDVERRVYGLRKELPRNTALRFRYHQLYQRYTTLTSYWQRTARQIEEGTYRLQLQRIKRRRVEEDDSRTLAPRAGDEGENEQTLAPPSYALNLDETLDVRQLLDEIDLDSVAKQIARTAPGGSLPPEQPTLPPAAARSTARFARPSMSATEPPRGLPRGPQRADDDDFDNRASIPTSADGGETGRPPPVIARPGAAAPAGPAGTQPKPAAVRVPPLGRPGMPAPGMRADEAALAPPPANDNASRFGEGVSPSMRPSIPVRPDTGAFPAPPPPSPGASPPASKQFARPPGAAGAGPTGATPGRPGAAPPIPVPSKPGTAPRAGPNQPFAGNPSVVFPQLGTRPSVPAPPAPGAPRPGLPAVPGAVGAAKPGAPPARHPASPAKPPSATEPAASFGEQRMRRLYDEYAAARRRNNEGDVRYETLAGSIQKMLPDLSKRHQGKQIDFEVVLKDGRVGLKPKAT